MPPWYRTQKSCRHWQRSLRQKRRLRRTGRTRSSPPPPGIAAKESATHEAHNTEKKRQLQVKLPANQLKPTILNAVNTLVHSLVNVDGHDWNNGHLAGRQEGPHALPATQDAGYGTLPMGPFAVLHESLTGEKIYFRI